MRTPYKACPLCDGTDLAEVATASCSSHPLYHKPLPAVMRWVSCQSCRHVFTDGYFTRHALSILFERANESQRPGDQAEQKRGVWARTVARVAELKSAGSWLDVGFGDGSALFVAAEWGYQAHGVDVRKSVVDEMRALGFSVQQGTLATVTDSFDIVSMFDVLEHTNFPKVELVEAHRVLNLDGLLIVSCPNMGCFAWNALDAEGANPYWGEIEHYHNFTRDRLCRLLAECGFEFVSFNVSERWRLGMEIIARKVS
jgi:protein O-GlcNAc transferase